jgi:hypothetical protein
MFVIIKHLNPSLIFVDKAGDYTLVKLLSGNTTIPLTSSLTDLVSAV